MALSVAIPEEGLTPYTLPVRLTAEYRFAHNEREAFDATAAYWNGIARRKDRCNPHGIAYPYTVTHIELSDNPFVGLLLKVTMERAAV